jgi:hypothetical protein
MRGAHRHPVDTRRKHNVWRQNASKQALPHTSAHSSKNQHQVPRRMPHRSIHLHGFLPATGLTESRHKISDKCCHTKWNPSNVATVPSKHL